MEKKNLILGNPIWISGMQPEKWNYIYYWTYSQLPRNSEKLVALFKGYYHRFWGVLLPFSELREVDCNNKQLGWIATPLSGSNDWLAIVKTDRHWEGIITHRWNIFFINVYFVHYLQRLSHTHTHTHLYKNKPN